MRRDWIRARIASKRSNPILSFIARGAEKYLRAYNNQRNWDPKFNGEARALQLITSLYSGDVVDVGANVGQWASMALGVIGNKRLHCFEAASCNFEKLRVNLGSQPNVTLNNCGLGDANKEIDFYFYPEYPPRSTAYCVEDGYKKVKISVPIVRGDDYVFQKCVGNISFLKLDVEGMEIDVLRGFAATLAAGRIQAIQFEHGHYHIITRHFLRDFVNLFQASNYEVLRMFPNGLRPLNYDIERDETFSGENFLAVHENIRRELLN